MNPQSAFIDAHNMHMSLTVVQKDVAKPMRPARKCRYCRPACIIDA